MRLAFCLYKYFPHSGLARDMRRVAEEAVRRGHHVDVYTRVWQDEAPAGMDVTLLDAGGLTNHGRAERFAGRLAERLRERAYDAVIGFNKIPGLDFYYAADGCFVARARQRRPPAYALTPRYRTWRRLEEAVFGRGSRTRVLLLSEQSRLEYRAYYATPDERTRLLPPILDQAHRLDPLDGERRTALRAALGVEEGETLLLLVGSGFHTKGVDRALRAVAALPAAERARARLLIAGRGKARSYATLVARLGLRDRVRFLGGRDDVPELLRAADVLIHPARQESAGAVLLEALAAGLPVLTTANCGYAHHVRDAGAGAVLNTPFDQRALDRALAELVAAPERDGMSASARRYGQDESLYRMPETVVDLVESWRETASGPAFTGYVHPELAELGRGLPRLKDWLDLQGEVQRRTRDRKTLRFEHQGRGYYIKAHFGVGWPEIIKNLLQLKWPVLGADNEWLALHRLMLLGIPTLTPVAYGAGPGLARRRSFVVTRALTGKMSLEAYAAQRSSRDPAELHRRRRFVENLANTARVLHGNGINHRDFYLCHFLFDPDAAAPDDIQLYVIDLHRAQIRRRVPRRWRVKDIGGLYYSALDAGVSRRECLQFIRTYTGAASLRQALSDRWFWTRVERRALALKRAERKRGYADVSGMAVR